MSCDQVEDDHEEEDDRSYEEQLEEMLFYCSPIYNENESFKKLEKRDMSIDDALDLLNESKETANQCLTSTVPDKDHNQDVFMGQEQVQSKIPLS
jgi:DNA-nicking Smr family endonuclease